MLKSLIHPSPSASVAVCETDADGEGQINDSDVMKQRVFNRDHMSRIEKRTKKSALSGSFMDWNTLGQVV